MLDSIGEDEYYLIGGHQEDNLRGKPGTILARRDGAICRATTDGAVWIPQLRRRPAPGATKTFKLPATLALRGCLDGVPEIPAPLATTPDRRTYREICYRECGDVGYLEFSFSGGAMSTGQCRRLLPAYWTYTLPRRVGEQEAARLTSACLPVSPAAALRSGLADRVIAGDSAGFRARVADLAAQLAASPGYPARLAAKTRQLDADGRKRPLAAYRAAELAIMRRNFSGPGEPYPELRRAFVHKEKPLHTPPYLARHRTHPWPARAGETSAPQTAA